MAEEEAAIIKKIKSTMDAAGMLDPGDSVLVGLSGGPDSVCLLHLLHQLRGELTLTLSAVYVNHNLRPEEIPGEIAFCEDLCRWMDARFFVKSADVPGHAKKQGMNTQEAARHLRYEIFENTAFEAGASKIALAHNADDQAETMFMRLIRGAGPKGLAGIPPKRGKVIRPLLMTSRDMIESYLKEHNLSFVTDSSNLKTDYARNRFRLKVMPEIKKMNPNVLNTLMTTSSILLEEERYLDIVVTKTLMKLISRKREHRIELFLSPLEVTDTVILRRVLRRALDAAEGLRAIEFLHVEDIIRLVKYGKPGDRIYLPRGIRVVRDYALLIITSEPPLKIAEYILRSDDEVAVVGAGVVVRASLQDDKTEPADGRTSVYLDADKLTFPLLIRPRTCGDFFYPHGFGKKKKLQDFMVDEKVPRDERDSIPILVSGGDILWVAGYRSDERFRPSVDTKKFLRLVIVKGKF